MQLRRLVFTLLLAGCGSEDGGGGGGGGGGLGCGDAVPACLTDALAALQACVPGPTLALGTPTNNSGIVENLRCTGGDLTVAFSTFSFSPTGTVPIPSTTTLTVAGTACATIKLADGTSTSGGTTRAFEAFTIERPGGEPVTIHRYATGEIGVSCDSRADELEAPASSLAACAASYAAPSVVRNDAITMMGVELVDASDGATSLFTCTR